MPLVVVTPQNIARAFDVRTNDSVILLLLLLCLKEKRSREQ